MGMTLKDFLSIKTPVVSEFGMCDLRPLVICNDGFHISIQASQYHNCDPEVANAETYESVEVSCEEDELLDEYDSGGVYAHVPVEIVEELLQKHGGIDVKNTMYYLIEEDHASKFEASSVIHYLKGLNKYR